MRTPISSQPSWREPDLVEALADGLAQLMVAKYRARHPQGSQQPAGATVVSRQGLNHHDDEPGHQEDRP